MQASSFTSIHAGAGMFRFIELEQEMLDIVVHVQCVATTTKCDSAQSIWCTVSEYTDWAVSNDRVQCN